MAGKNIFSKVLGNVKTPNTPTVNSLKKEIEEKIKEKNKLYGFIGMEVYDQCQEGRLKVPELETHLEKMRTLDEEIVALQSQKQSIELQEKGTTICQCGCVLKANQSFCTNCGRTVDNGKLTCVCGKEIKKEEKFCPYCGANIQQLLQENGQQPLMRPGMAQQIKTCICGAVIQDGQFMCMECGRKVE